MSIWCAVHQRAAQWWYSDFQVQSSVHVQTRPSGGVLRGFPIKAVLREQGIWMSFKEEHFKYNKWIIWTFLQWFMNWIQNLLLQNRMAIIWTFIAPANISLSSYNLIHAPLHPVALFRAVAFSICQRSTNVKHKIDFVSVNYKVTYDCFRNDTCKHSLNGWLSC